MAAVISSHALVVLLFMFSGCFALLVTPRKKSTPESGAATPDALEGHVSDPSYQLKERTNER